MSTRRSPRSYRFIGAVGANRLVTRLHPVAYRLMRGRGPISRMLGMHMVVLETTGRVSGRRIDVPLFATADETRLVVVASNGGRPREPAWAGNLRARADVTVVSGGRRVAMRAREVDGEERDRLWALAAAAYPGYDDYARWWAPARIPVFALEPVGA